MDAGMVLATPPQSSTLADAAPDRSAEDANLFAAHLDDKAPAKPTPRKPTVTRDEDVDRDDEDKSAAPPPSYSLSAPTSPVLVREDGAPPVLNIALTPANAPAGSPTPGAAPTDAGAPLAPHAAPPGPQRSPISGDDKAPVPGPPPTQPLAVAAAPDPSAAALIASAELGAANPNSTAAPVKSPTAEPNAEPARNAGKGRGVKSGVQAAADAKPASASASNPTIGAPGDSKPEFIAASTPKPGSTSASINAAAQPGSPDESAAVMLEARRAAEAAPLAVHRPPSLAATVAQHVIRRFDGKSTSIEVRLDPAELGRVSVKLDVGADSRVTAIVAADNPATLSDLMRSARELERALESAGLELTQGGLSFDLSDRRSENGASTNEAGATGPRAGNDNAVAAPEASAPASRPFGLESWRGVRIDVTV